jgi:hypothetical protein
VTGFVGHGGDPIALSVPEVFEMLKGPERPTDRKAAEEETAPGKPAKRVEVSAEYNVGDVVTVIDGPFESLQATISEVNPEAQRVTAMVELSGSTRSRRSEPTHYPTSKPQAVRTHHRHGSTQEAPESHRLHQVADRGR